MLGFPELELLMEDIRDFGFELTKIIPPPKIGTSNYNLHIKPIQNVCSLYGSLTSTIKHCD